MSRQYTQTRVRGLADWNPHRKTKVLLDQVQAVLDDYSASLPLTCRQIFYRLVGAYNYPKTEAAYSRLGDKLNRARRAKLIPFAAIRDDGVSEKDAGGFDGKADFWRSVLNAAKQYHRPRLHGQPYALECWCEAAGMIPQLVGVAEPFGISVYSSGGFDSVTAKYDTARRFASAGRDTVVLHIGDHDASGWAIFDSLEDDVSAMLEDMDSPYLPTFQRVAITEAQIVCHALPEAPPKKTDNRGGWTEGTVQAEALPPDALARELRQAVESYIDRGALDEVHRLEDQERREILKTLDELT